MEEEEAWRVLESHQSKENLEPARAPLRDSLEEDSCMEFGKNTTLFLTCLQGKIKASPPNEDDKKRLQRKRNQKIHPLHLRRDIAP